MEVDRIHKVADMIEAHPEHFDMSWFLSRNNRMVKAVAHQPRLVAEVDLFSCGTTACIAGWAVGLWPAEVDRHEDIVAAGAHILGLPLIDAINLFSASLRTADAAAAHLRGMADDFEAAGA